MNKWNNRDRTYKRPKVSCSINNYKVHESDVLSSGTE